MEYTLDGSNSRQDIEERLCELEHKALEIIQNKTC